MANQSLGAPTGGANFLPTADAKPALQNALEALSVNLEDELTRYRQSRTGSGVVQPSGAQLRFRSQRRRRGVNLIQVQSRTAVSQGAQGPLQAGAAPTPTVIAPTAQPGPTPPLPPANPRLQSPPAQPGRSEGQTYGPQSITRSDLQRRGGAIIPGQPSPNSYLESTEALLDSLPGPYDGEHGYDDGDYEPSLREQLSTPLGIGALLLLLLGSASFGYVVTSPQTAEFLRSNALVQALRGGWAEPQVQEPAPVELEPETGLQGLGPDLSEDEFQELDLDRLSTLDEADAIVPNPRPPQRRASPTLDLAPSAAAPTNAPSPAPAPGARAAVAPNSNAPESAPVTTTPTPVPRPQATTAPAQPTTVPQPRVRTAPTPVPLPQVMSPPQPVSPTPPQPVLRAAPPTAPATPSAPPQPLATNPAPRALPQPQVAPPAPLPPPEAAPAEAPTVAPAPITQPPPQPVPSYYVVTDYTGDQSLQSARSAVGGAYVRNFPNGARIQMGAFSQESSARSLVQQLQGQGIPAQVYSP